MEPRPSGDRTRTGAAWVTALGAFMLFAAAAVFVAVRWDELTDALKLGVLGALTGACLLAGQRLRPALPATAGILFHLGAFLVPVNVAAVVLHLDAAWPALLLVEGLIATVTWTALGRRSRILSGTAIGAAVVAAAGFSATVASAGGPFLPTALVVAGAAAVAEVGTGGRRGDRAALAWAVVAGAAPVLGLVERTVPLGTDVTGLLGLTGSTPGLTAAASGLLAAGVLGRIAARRRVPALLVVAVAVAALGSGSAWLELRPGAGTSLVGLAALFLAVEAAAALTARDSFWGRPSALAAGAAEAVAAVGGAAALGGALVRFATQPSRIATEALAAGLLAAAGWLVADLRRDPVTARSWRARPAGWAPATAGAVAALLAGVVAGTGQADVVAITAVALAALALLTARSGAHPIAVVLVVGAPWAQPVAPVAVTAGATGAVLLALGAVAREWWAAPPPPGTPDRADRSTHHAAAWMLALAAVIALAETAAVALDGLGGGTDATAAVLAGFVLAAVAVAAVLDGAPAPAPAPAAGGSLRLSAAGRAAAVVALVGGIGLPAAHQAALAALVTGLAALDGLRLDRPGPLWALPVALPALGAQAAATADAGPPTIGLVLAVLATACAGAHLLAGAARPSWGTPLLVTSGTALLAAVALTAPSPEPFATVVLLAGAIGILLGTAHGHPELVIAGTVVTTAGVWLHLAAARVSALDAYAAPVALALAAAGWWAERSGDRPVSSWVTYAPAVVLAGGTALVERVAGGPGGHALLAGAVGLAAVVAGGGRRLIGPLVAGTALVIALTVHESLGVTRQVPTWAWLAAGGTALVAVGLWLERRETGPVEAGRRVVDVLSERFG